MSFLLVDVHLIYVQAILSQFSKTCNGDGDDEANEDDEADKDANDEIDEGDMNDEIDPAVQNHDATLIKQIIDEIDEETEMLSFDDMNLGYDSMSKASALYYFTFQTRLSCSNSLPILARKFSIALPCVPTLQRAANGTK